MIKVNAVLDKYLAQNSPGAETKGKAAEQIKILLEQLDLDAEVVPENSLDMFTRLLTSLKGKPLNNNEKEVVVEIINYKRKE